MSSALSSTSRLIAALARGERAGPSSRPVTELPDRRATRVDAPAPSRLDLLAFVQDHDAHVAAYVARHGVPMESSGRDRSAVFAAAGLIAQGDRAAAEELRVLDMEDYLRTALGTPGGTDVGVRAVASIPCPQCMCWSLLPIRSPRGGWAAACRRTRCGTSEGPRIWTLHALAVHQVRLQAKAA
jgi:hypothetical protein